MVEYWIKDDQTDATTFIKFYVDPSLAKKSTGTGVLFSGGSLNLGGAGHSSVAEEGEDGRAEGVVMGEEEDGRADEGEIIIAAVQSGVAEEVRVVVVDEGKLVAEIEDGRAEGVVVMGEEEEDGRTVEGEGIIAAGQSGVAEEVGVTVVDERKLVAEVEDGRAEGVVVMGEEEEDGIAEGVVMGEEEEDGRAEGVVMGEEGGGRTDEGEVIIAAGHSGVAEEGGAVNVVDEGHVVADVEESVRAEGDVVMGEAEDGRAGDEGEVIEEDFFNEKTIEEIDWMSSLF